MTTTEIRRDKYLRKNYGISSSQYETMLLLCGGGCWVCGRLPKNRSLDVDHAHDQSKKVRGLLCHICNKYRVGKNTLESARKVLAYLELDFDGRRLKKKRKTKKGKRKK